MIILGEVHVTGGEGRGTGKAYTVTAHDRLSVCGLKIEIFFNFLNFICPMSARNYKTSSEMYFEIILNKTPK